MVSKTTLCAFLLKAIQCLLASLREQVWNDTIAELKNTVHFERYVSGIFANQEKIIEE